MKKTLITIIILLIIAIIGLFIYQNSNSEQKYEKPPEQNDGQNNGQNGAPQYYGNEEEKLDLIILESPRPNTAIKSPVTITGMARGYWFFEASFPITIVDWDGLIIGEGYATADGEWMTTDFVPFSATVDFDKSQIRGQYSMNGSLILQKDNPSGLPEHDDALEVPIVFQ
ncbi:MAG TPA: Gmad2 immunoglobulin-like domain-containing protein [Candidatus Paceibacterota bacterium]|nr:Gmad2 immunoglobulin-like domain-containing protein [Candidatus Paceibacterota bacterium]